MEQLYALIPDMESKEKAADVAMEAVRLFLQDLLGARPWNSRAFADEDRTGKLLDRKSHTGSATQLFAQQDT
jgi:hypothetical protein